MDEKNKNKSENSINEVLFGHVPFKKYKWIIQVLLFLYGILMMRMSEPYVKIIGYIIVFPNCLLFLNGMAKALFGKTKLKKYMWIIHVILFISGILMAGTPQEYVMITGCIILITYCSWFLYGMVKLFFIEPVQEKNERERLRNIAREQIKEIATYKNRKLRLSSRSSYLRDMVGVMPATTTTMYKNPEKVHYGAATVGGVTTGGVYTTGGELYGKTVTYGGTCKMVYDGKEIDSIYLTEDLAQQAKRSEIKIYCQGNEIIVNEQIRNFSSTAMLLAQAGDLSLINQERAQGFPTYQKAELIIKWISNEI